MTEVGLIDAKPIRRRLFLDLDHHHERIEALRDVQTPPASEPVVITPRLPPKPIAPLPTPASLADWFDRVFVINLDRRVDRWERLLQHLDDIRWPFRKPERFRAVDGKLVPPPSWWRAGGGAWGCLQSHLRILEIAMMDRLQRILILEDDVTFVADFRERVERYLHALPEDWDHAYLGGQHLGQFRHPPLRINDEVVRPYNVNRTHAHAISRRFFKPMHRYLNDQLTHARHPRHHVDHRLGYMQQAGRSSTYAPTTWLAGQGESYSNISGRTNRERFWPTQRFAEPQAPYIAVIGLHRSGSSCIAGVLHHLGVFMGRDLGGYEWPCGFEDQTLARLCERAFPFPSVVAALPVDEIKRKLAEHIRSVTSLAMRMGRFAGGKYPHLCALGPELRDACGSNLRVLHIDRPLDESIESLQRRARRATGWLAITPQQAEQLQRWLWREKTALLASVEHLTIRYADLRADPAREIDRIVEWLGRPAHPDRRAEAIAYVRPHEQAAAT